MNDAVEIKVAEAICSRLRLFRFGMLPSDPDSEVRQVARDVIAITGVPHVIVQTVTVAQPEDFVIRSYRKFRRVASPVLSPIKRAALKITGTAA